ncbi:serine hydroxymethyltransferase [Piscinibacter sakaiensis]|uniref:Probable serine hydroxymethyltransferase n=1 Tax=Piscinibacter sakaiensis TaxID=1547922 RepID=A0A0K8P3D1_PISS1|nr:serine hydroxymethyltransferase [Piscinibacter sakaiensis]GAP37157.1 serine hydroxymethyltransferase [Piscinibacter sakaiensis]
MSTDALLHPGYFSDGLDRIDPLIADAIAREKRRTRDVIELIASENIVSRAVLEVQGSVLTNKTVEGLPGKRYHAGAENVDAVERAAIERACRLFGCSHANVQPHSGSQANHAVLHAVAEPGDTVLSMDLNAGGHLSHGASANASSRWFRFVHYGVRADDGLIDYDAVVDLARQHRPKLLIAGGSAYPRALDFAAFRRAADAGGARLLVDMAHFAGLVAGGAHPSPFPHADIVTTTTYKSLRGPRGALVLWNDPALRKPIDRAVFPGMQGTPSLHIVAAKAVALGEALRPEFRAYAQAVLANARALAARLQGRGFDLVGGGTDTPLMLVDLRRQGLDGALSAQSLERAGIIANMNPIPSDAADLQRMSGLRFGVSGATTRGLGRREIEAVGDLVAEVLAGLQRGPDASAAAEEAVRRRVAELVAPYPTYR